MKFHDDRPVYPPEYDKEDPGVDIVDTLREAFPDFEGLGELARAIYRYTTCGAWVVARVGYSGSDVGGELYCDTLGTWEDLEKSGRYVTHLLVGSIVEGVEETTETIVVPVLPYAPEAGKSLARAFMEAVGIVERQADAIWDATHGCEHCAELQGIEFEPGDVPVMETCPECLGMGIVL